jgi:hypothetical protein
MTSDPLEGLTFSSVAQATPEDVYDMFWLGEYESDDELTQDDNGDINDGTPVEEAHATKVG